MSRSSDPTKLAAWRERLERFSSSQMAVAPFCAREGVSASLFYYWRKKLGHNGRRRRMRDGHPRHRTYPTGGRGVFQQVAAARGMPVLVRGGRGFIPVASGLVPAARAVAIQLCCGTRIEVEAADLDAVRAVVGEVVRADRDREASVARC